MKEIPDDVLEWLEFGGGNTIYNIKTPNCSEIEGVEIITGVVGNEQPKEVAEFVKENTTKNYLAVNTSRENKNEWGSMAVPFTSREKAEKFQSLISQNDGSLRLSSGGFSDWFVFEAE